MPPIILTDRFAADPFDTRQIKLALNRLGLYQPLAKTGLTDIPDRAVFDALKKFQKDHGLPADGVAKPDDATITALNDAVAQKTSGFYIWRTMRDDKVRSEHRDREGHVFSWEIEPEGGYPGETFGCRCWAEPFKNRLTRPKQNCPVCFEARGWKQDTLKLLMKQKHEAFVPYPYLDTQGLITVGIGLNVDNKNDFIKMPFKYKKKGSTEKDWKKLPWANISEKSAAYNELKGFYSRNKKSDGTINLNNTEYKEKTQLSLPKQLAQPLAMGKIDQFEQELLKILPDFKCYPSPARQAIMDMMYNMGATRFKPVKWVNFFKAVRKRDWDTAAAESHRTGIAEERNDNVSALFLEAAVLEKETLY